MTIKNRKIRDKTRFYRSKRCDTTITDSILVRLVDLLIPNVFTPNGDGFNDTFQMKEKELQELLTFWSLSK